jgi:hypothetical protein
VRTTRWTALALAVPILGGCAAAGGLQDAGPARAVGVRPSPEQLWPAARPAALPSPGPTGYAPPPEPLAGITVPGGDIRTVDARAVLAKDPGLRPEEQDALPGCAGCLVQPAQYRDLTGDGRPELITAVLTGTDAYLHVYRLLDGRLYPVLAQRVQQNFTADTVGQDLVVHEPDGPQSSTGTDTTYRWQGTRLLRADRRITGTGPAEGATLCPAPRAGAPEPVVSAAPSAVASPAPAKAPTDVPSAAPTAAPEPRPSS